MQTVPAKRSGTDFAVSLQSRYWGQSLAIHDTLYRQWQMLRLIPRYPNMASTQSIHQRLKDSGYATTDRTVARDLDGLSSIFGYSCEEDGRAKLWFWPQGMRMMDIPGMEPNAALAWLMSRGYLEKALPPAAIQHLQPYFERAQEILSSTRGLKQGRWTRLFRVSRRGPLLSAPAVDEAVFETTCQALVEQCCIDAKYQGRGAQAPKDLLLHPQALVFRHGIYYLVAIAGDYETPVHFALHRFTAAAIISRKRKQPVGMDIDAYVEKSFRYPNSPKQLNLRMRVTRDVAAHLAERQLSENQSLNYFQDDAWAEVTASVDDTAELRWWLLGFGDQVIVDAPQALRNELRQTIQQMAGHYEET
jgi:predicted DNA-binding transcriptional regulator YafY